MIIVGALLRLLVTLVVTRRRVPVLLNYHHHHTRDTGTRNLVTQYLCPALMNMLIDVVPKALRAMINPILPVLEDMQMDTLAPDRLRLAPPVVHLVTTYLLDPMVENR